MQDYKANPPSYSSVALRQGIEELGSFVTGAAMQLVGSQQQWSQTRTEVQAINDMQTSLVYLDVGRRACGGLSTYHALLSSPGVPTPIPCSPPRLPRINPGPWLWSVAVHSARAAGGEGVLSNAGCHHQGANPGAPAAQRRCSSAPGGSSTQWATAGAPEAPCGKEWWARQGKEPPTKPGWAERRTTARSQCSANHRDTVRSRARGAHAHGNTERQVVDGLRTEVCGQQQQSNYPHNNQHILNTPTTGRR